MKTAKLREARNKHPFRPFDIHTSDGRAIPVVTTDHMMISPKDDEVLVYAPNGQIHFLDIDSVTGVTWQPRRGSKKPGSQ